MYGEFARYLALSWGHQTHTVKNTQHIQIKNENEYTKTTKRSSMEEGRYIANGIYHPVPRNRFYNSSIGSTKHSERPLLHYTRQATRISRESASTHPEPHGCSRLLLRSADLLRNAFRISHHILLNVHKRPHDHATQCTHSPCRAIPPSIITKRCDRNIEPFEGQED